MAPLAHDPIEGEAKLVLQTVVDKYDSCDLENGYIETAKMPEILSNLVKHYDEDEMNVLIQAKDPEGTGKLDLVRASQIIIYFLKEEANRKKEMFLKVTLKITAQLCISDDLLMVVLSFYPQIIKSIEDGQCVVAWTITKSFRTWIYFNPILTYFKYITQRL